VARRLTQRELDVLRLSARGFNAPEIAQKLSLSVNTVRNYLGRAAIKLGVRGAKPAVETARREGLL